MIRKATINDIPSIMDTIRLTVEEMKSYNNTQWDENYPLSKDFKEDIQNGDLYVHDVDGEVYGFICVNYIEPKEYDNLNWSSNEKAMVVHRVAVNPTFRNKGIGSKLLKFADDLAKENNVAYLKTDTYSINVKMNSLFKKCGYKHIGEMDFLGKEKPFYCYDKKLSDE